MDKYNELRPRIDALKNKKEGLTDKIKMYNYYTRGTVGGKIPVTQQPLNRTYFKNPYRPQKKVKQLDVYPVKCDTSAESITSDGTSAFVSACLPFGVESIEVEFFDAKYKNYRRLTNAQKNMIADIGGIITKNIQYFLKKPEYYFTTRICTAITHYIEYGFAVVKTETSDTVPLKIINFDPELSFFDFEIGADNETPTFFLLGENTNNDEIKRQYPSFKGKGGDRKEDLGKENTIWYYYYREKDGRWTYFVYDDNNNETLDFKTKCPHPNIFVANRSNKSGCYGIGDGISALSAIITINETSEGIRRAISIITNPPIIVDERAHTSHVTHSGEVRDGFDATPGATTNVRPPTESTQAKDSIALAFGGNPIEVAPLYQIMEGAKAELRQAFSADLFSNGINPSTEQTATEINTRTSQALHRFKGKANNFYDGLLIPLIKDTVLAQIFFQFKGVGGSLLRRSDLEVDEIKGEKMGEIAQMLIDSNLFEADLIAEIPSKHTIKILSFGDQLSKDRDIANGLQQLQILSGLKQNHQGDPEIEADILKLAKSILEELNKSTGV